MNPGRAGLYVHVPFCSAICPYCDFAVTTGRRSIDGPRFVEAVLAEFRASPFVGPFDTIYFGGGTPSWLETRDFTRVVEALRADDRVTADAALHVEANPEDVTAEAVDCWRALDVAFLSLGVQSLDDGELRELGRAHDGDEARTAVRRAVEGGIPTVSFDVIFGLPGSSPRRISETIRKATELGVQHVSAYQLTIHEGTPFSRLVERGEMTPLGDDGQADLFGHVHAELASCGFEAYEVSNFARDPAHRSRHNQKYWNHAPYLGLGPSAHSFDGRTRWWNARTFRTWADTVESGRSPIEEREELSNFDLALESVMLGLRTRGGVDFGRIAREWKLEPTASTRAAIEVWKSSGLVVRDGSRLRATPSGWAVADGLARSVEFASVEDVT